MAAQLQGDKFERGKITLYFNSPVDDCLILVFCGLKILVTNTDHILGNRLLWNPKLFTVWFRYELVLCFTPIMECSTSVVFSNRVSGCTPHLYTASGMSMLSWMPIGREYDWNSKHPLHYWSCATLKKSVRFSRTVLDQGRYIWPSSLMNAERNDHSRWLSSLQHVQICIT
jgi:hypothetical protein